MNPVAKPKPVRRSFWTKGPPGVVPKSAPVVKKERGHAHYPLLNPERLHAVVLVFVHVVRAAVDAGLLRSPREVCWVKQSPTHLAIHLVTTVAKLADAGVFRIERHLLHRAIRWAEAELPELFASHAPIVYFNGKRDRRVAEVLDWPAVLRFLDAHADYLTPVHLPTFTDNDSASAPPSAEHA